MNAFQLTKNDFWILLLAAALIPVCCFVSGFYTANRVIVSPITNQELLAESLTPETASTPDTTNELAVSEPLTLTQTELDPPIESNTIPDDSATFFKTVTATEPTVVTDAIVQTDLKIEPKTTPASPVFEYVVQAGLFSKYKNAVQAQSALLTQGLSTQIADTPKEGKHLYRIVLESFDSQTAATQFLKRTKEKYSIDLYIARLSSDRYSKAVAIASL